MVKGKKYILRKHFEGEPKESDLSIVEFEVPVLKDGEILVEAEYLSVDPYMRFYTTHLPTGTTMIGSQIGKIIGSKNPKWPIGKRIFGYFGWTTHCIFDPKNPPIIDLLKQKPYILPDFGDLPPSLGLGMLGMTGNTAYFGFLEICKPVAGETLVVTSAGGAVGSHVGQLGKILGLKVIGIAGSDDKCKRLVDELGFDHAINYKTENVSTVLRKVAPNGIDCYFDNVGGEISSQVMCQMNAFGRVSVCGSITSYNSDAKGLQKATVLQPSVVMSQLKIEGFHASRWMNDRWMEGIEKNLNWIKGGQLKYKETVTEGFEHMLKALAGMLKGENFGKAIVKI